MSFRDVTKQQPCAGCGHTKWCSRDQDTGREICRRVPHDLAGWTPKRGKNGQPYYLSVAAANKNATPEHSTGEVVTERTDAIACDRAYRAMCDALDPRLDDENHTALKKRGLSDAEIERGGYCTWAPNRAVRSEMLRAAAVAVEEEMLRRVPGVYFDPKDGKLHLGGKSNVLAIPVRDGQGRILAMQFRVVDEDGQKRYVWLSSAGKGDNRGTSPGAPCHVPLHDVALRNGIVRISEGALKADIATQRSEVLTLGLAGVTQWPAALPLLKEISARRVLIAFDADVRTNPHVAAALHALATALRSDGYELGIEVW